MEIIEDKKRKMIIILEDVGSFTIRFFFSKSYIDFLKLNGKTPEDIYKKESDYFKKDIKSDTYIIFGAENDNDLNFLDEDRYENLDKAYICTYRDNKFHVYQHFFLENKE